MGVDTAGEELLVITEKGYGKRTPLSEYRIQNRGGKGILTANITEKNGDIAAAKIVDEDKEMMVITLEGIIIRVKASEISQTSRNTIGVRIINVEEEDRVVSLARISEEELEDDIEEELDEELNEEQLDNEQMNDDQDDDK